jgi:hypothetical protein
MTSTIAVLEEIAALPESEQLRILKILEQRLKPQQLRRSKTLQLSVAKDVFPSPLILEPSNPPAQQDQMAINKEILKLLDKWEEEGDEQEQTATVEYLSEVLS